MKGLAWWMRIVGVFYVLLGVQNLPFIVRGRLSTQYPGFEAPLDGIAAKALVDTWFMFGIEIGVVGLFLIYASRSPFRHRLLVYLVLALELFRGVLHDLHLVSRGYAVESFYLAFAAVHLVIIGIGLFFLRQARRAVAAKSAPLE